MRTGERDWAGVLVLVAALLPVIASSALAADLDPSFGTDGVTTVDVAPGSDNVRRIAIQPDGRTLVVGTGYEGSSTTAFVARFDHDGRPDPTFGTGGMVHPYPGPAMDLALQPDGKIVVVGAVKSGPDYDPRWDMVAARLDTAGRLDPDFGTEGVVRLTGSWYRYNPAALAVALQADGRIVVAGSASHDPKDRNRRSFAVTRLNPNGSLDTGFGDAGWGTGTLVGGPSFMALDGDGTILLAGGHTPPFFGASSGPVAWAVLARYTPDGHLSASTYTDLGNRNPTLGGMALLPDGRILTVMEIWQAGLPSPDILVWYRPDLSVEREAVVPAGGTCRCARALATVEDGSGGLVVGGLVPRPEAYASDVTVLRLAADGTPLAGGETTIDVGGHDEVKALAVIPDGRVVVAGGSGPATAEGGAGSSLFVARIAVPATAQNPYSTWSGEAATPLSGMGTWVAAAGDPTAGPGQLAPRYLYALGFGFAGTPASGLVALGTGPSGKFAVFNVTPPESPAQVVAVPFAWEPGRMYFLLVWHLGGGQWGAWVYDYSANAWTVIGSLSLPATLTRLAPAALTAAVWYGTTPSNCRAYPFSDALFAPPLALARTQVTAMTHAGDSVTAGACAASVSKDSGWSRYRTGSR